MEIESNGLDFRSWKSSPRYSVSFIQHTDMKSPRKNTWMKLTCSVLLSTKQSMWVEIKNFFLYCTLSNIYKYFFIFISRHARKKFELLEKHKDYVERAQAFHKKEDTLRVSVLASCLAGNQTLKYIMGLFCKWVFFFLLYRNLRRKQLLETQMNFTSKWSKQELLMESIN